jgi:hypothetical protein
MNTQLKPARGDEPFATSPESGAQSAVQLLAPSLSALYACQHAWEKHHYFFTITSPSFYCGWREESFARDSTRDSHILKRMDVLEEILNPDRYILFHEPEDVRVPQKAPVSLPKWVLPAGMALIAVGGIWMLTTAVAVAGATAVVAAPVAFAALDPSLVAVCQEADGAETWIEICWWWNG